MKREGFAVLFLVLLLPLASAHGGDDTQQDELISSGQILLISVVGALGLWQLTAVMWNIRAEKLSPHMVGLAGYSGFVHLFLGIEDPLLLVGGIGVMTALCALVLFDLGEQRHRTIQLALGTGVIVMFAGYFASNHDVHMVLEDRLGLTTKLAELAFIMLLYRSQFRGRAQDK